MNTLQHVFIKHIIEHDQSENKNYISHLSAHTKQHKLQVNFPPVALIKAFLISS